MGADSGDNGEQTGSVKWFDDSKGYGFIAPEGASKDVFVHHSNIVGTGFKSLQEGAPVKFKVRQTDRGTEAYDVSVIGS